MKHNRLEGVLDRNRKHIVLDLCGAAFLVVVLLFSGLTIGAELSVLSSTGSIPVASAATQAEPAGASAVTAVCAVVDERVARR